jgi:AcrR family transcriptional regulator
MDATVSLLARGEEPSVGEIAEAADVSRRTVYLYFPTLDHLLADAALELVRASRDVGPSIEAHAFPEARVEALVRGVQQGFRETEALGRTIIRLTVGATGPGATPRRGYRRVAWIEQALEPLRDSLRPDRFELLVSALTLTVGWEAMIVLEDTRGLDEQAAEDVCAWAAQALLAAATRPAT